MLAAFVGHVKIWTWKNVTSQAKKYVNAINQAMAGIAWQNELAKKNIQSVNTAYHIKQR